VVGRLSRGLVCAGLVLAVVGTFLPWLRSGHATRNSYATDGAVRRLVELSGSADLALRVWPFVSLLAAVALALVLLGVLRIGLVAAAVAALLTGAVAVWALNTEVHGLIHPAAPGPTVTLLGACLVGAGVLACASSLHHRTGGTREHTNGTAGEPG
jgi:hypothetical protein